MVIYRKKGNRSIFSMLVSVILVLMCLGSMFVMPVSAKAEFLLGDVNADGVVKSTDARTVLRYALGLDVSTEFTEQSKLVADWDGDSKVSVKDARSVLRFALGLIEYPEWYLKLSESEAKVINVPAIEQKSLVVDKLSQKSATMEDAEILTFTGEMEEQGQADEYTFTSKNSGLYSVDVIGASPQFKAIVSVYNEAGKQVASSVYGANFLIIEDIRENEKYTLKIRGDSKVLGKYTVKLGMQKETFDISEYSEIKDKHEFKAQRNVYTFTAPRDGQYRFQLVGLDTGASVKMYLLNSINEEVEVAYRIQQIGGITIKNLKKGQTYFFYIQDNSTSLSAITLSSYTLQIGIQKETVDITDYTEIKDSVEYIEQSNIYTFIAPRDGRYCFHILNMEAGANIQLLLFDELGNRITTEIIRGAGSMTGRNLKKGKQYTLYIDQWTSYDGHTIFSDYTLMFGIQKETVEVSRGYIVNDSCEFENQVNVYLYTADSDEELVCTINNMPAGVHATMAIYNEAGELVREESYRSNGGTITLKNPELGANYYIRISISEKVGNYTLTFD